MPRKEKYVEWTTISIPKEFRDQIKSYLEYTKQIPSVSNFMVLLMRKYLNKFMEEGTEPETSERVERQIKEKKAIGAKKAIEFKKAVEAKKAIEFKKAVDVKKAVDTQKEREAKKAVDVKKAIKAKKERGVKKKVKNSKFVECHRSLLNAEKALQKNDKNKARKLYIQARDVYAQLGYSEKKRIYKEFMEIYNRFK